MKVKVSKEVAEAINELYQLCAGFQYEMYCKMNSYLFSQSSACVNPKLEALRKANLFEVTDAIRHGYVIND